MAVRGDLTAADSIGRAELSHRVLAGAAPDETAPARLAGEGVTFDDAGRPDPARRVSWDELARRAATTTERRHEPSREPGLLPCIAVDSIDEVLQAMPAAGGEVVQPPYADRGRQRLGSEVP